MGLVDRCFVGGVFDWIIIVFVRVGCFVVGVGIFLDCCRVVG